MKKIINGKKYDTETAEKIGDWGNGCYPNDFRVYSETLYRKKTGEYFLHGSGGPLSKYGVAVGNGMGWGAIIQPLSIESARQWAEECLDADDYEKNFGEVDENEQIVMLSFELPSDLKKQFQEKTQGECKTMSQVLKELIQKYVS